MNFLNKIFSHKIEFDENEIILKHKITSMLYLSLLGGLGLLMFSIFRYLKRNTIVSITQAIFGIILLMII